MNLPSHDELALFVARWLCKTHWVSATNVEWLAGGRPDVLATTHPNRRSRSPRISVVEVKRTRGDLLRDVRARKMWKYVRHATHFYIAVGPEIPREMRGVGLYTELRELGVPREWGMLRLNEFGGVSVIHRPSRLQEAGPERRQRTANVICASTANRLLTVNLRRQGEMELL